MTLVQPTKRDQIVDELRRQILSGELARGERMPQDDLADCDRVAVATETHLRNGFSAILSRLVDDPGPDPFDAE